MATRDISLPMAVDEIQNDIPIDQSNENGLGEDGKPTRSFSEQWKDAKKDGCCGIIIFFIAWYV